MFNQVLQFLDENLSPAKGGKIQISINTESKTEKIKAFIFDKEINSYSYILCFTKENIDNIDTFKTAIISGFSGMEYKLGVDLTLEIYEAIKKACLTADAVYMQELEREISSIVLEESPKEEVVNVD